MPGPLQDANHQGEAQVLHVQGWGATATTAWRDRDLRGLLREKQHLLEQVDEVLS
ncbi:MAG: hypothetical protein NVS4B12_18070 [Ktedonobacteraceae bacterium]